MAKFQVLQTVTGSTGPSWKQLAQWTNTRSIKSVEFVAKKQRDGTVHIEIRGWRGLRDDTDDLKVKSNSPRAKENTEYTCPKCVHCEHCPDCQECGYKSTES